LTLLIRTVAGVLVAFTTRHWLTTVCCTMKEASPIGDRVVSGRTRLWRVEAHASTRHRVCVSCHQGARVPVGAVDLLQPAVWVSTNSTTS